jgi:hypothetical protein
MFGNQLTILVIIPKTGIMFYIKMCESGGFALLKKDPAPRRRGILGCIKSGFQRDSSRHWQRAENNVKPA